jgi:hypothetical protein
MKEIKHNPNKVLAFSASKRLVAIFHSQKEVAKALKATPQSIHYACSGQTISCQKMYFRQWSDNIEIEWGDLGTLNLKEYDELCGVERKVYPTRKMSRKGMKYKKRETETKRKRRTIIKQDKPVKTGELQTQNTQTA